MVAKRPKRAAKSRPAADRATRGGDALGLEDALAGIAPPADELEAGFFHRTLARWLGLPEAQGDAPMPVLWSYDFWKAEIIELGVERGRLRFAAQVYRGVEVQAERYQYWLELDAARRIRRSGWETSAPDLTREADSFAPPHAPTAAELAALFHDVPADE